MKKLFLIACILITHQIHGIGAGMEKPKNIKISLAEWKTLYGVAHCKESLKKITAIVETLSEKAGV